MKNSKVFIGGVLLLTSITTNSFAEYNTQGTNTMENFTQRPHKCPKPVVEAKVSYNPASTVLNVSFPGNWQGGKVEIYRNGTRVVGVKAQAGASLCYTLRNYGKGEFTIIVSQGNMVVYRGSYNVK
ncbi:MAG: hypothetical protein IJ911_04205 [Salinivirgaceae bacterium]|nr:hypothetical protein [Salinivirgaceae bacterium]